MGLDFVLHFLDIVNAPVCGRGEGDNGKHVWGEGGTFIYTVGWESFGLAGEFWFWVGSFEFGANM